MIFLKPKHRFIDVANRIADGIESGRLQIRNDALGNIYESIMGICADRDTTMRLITIVKLALGKAESRTRDLKRALSLAKGYSLALAIILVVLTYVAHGQRQHALQAIQWAGQASQEAEKTRERFEVLSRVSSSHRSIALAPNRPTVAVPTSEGGVQIWNYETGNYVSSLEGPKGSITHLVYSPNGGLLAFANSEGYIGVWAVQEGRTAKELKISSKPVIALAFGPDGSTIVSRSADGEIQVLDAATFHMLRRFEIPRNLSADEKGTAMAQLKWTDYRSFPAEPDQGQ